MGSMGVAGAVGTVWVAGAVGVAPELGATHPCIGKDVPLAIHLGGFYSTWTALIQPSLSI